MLRSMKQRYSHRYKDLGGLLHSLILQLTDGRACHMACPKDNAAGCSWDCDVLRGRTDPVGIWATSRPWHTLNLHTVPLDPCLDFRSRDWPLPLYLGIICYFIKRHLIPLSRLFTIPIIMFSSSVDLLINGTGPIIMLTETLMSVIKRPCLLTGMQDLPLGAGRTRLEISVPILMLK